MTLTLRERLAAKADDELVDLLLRRDADQWRAEVFTLAEDILRGRGVTPPRPPAQRRTPPSFNHALVQAPVGLQDLVVVARFPSVVAADACVSALRAAGYAPVVLNEAVLLQDPTMAPAYDWVQLAVPESQAAEVAEFLAAAHEP